MRPGKRGLGVVLSVLLLAGLFPLTAAAQVESTTSSAADVEPTWADRVEPTVYELDDPDAGKSGVLSGSGSSEIVDSSRVVVEGLQVAVELDLPAVPVEEEPAPTTTTTTVPETTTTTVASTSTSLGVTTTSTMPDESTTTSPPTSPTTVAETTTTTEAPPPVTTTTVAPAAPLGTGGLRRRAQLREQRSILPTGRRFCGFHVVVNGVEIALRGDHCRTERHRQCASGQTDHRPPP